MSGEAIRIFKNRDKGFVWKSSDPLVPSSSDRFCISGPPGCGKRVALMNILCRLDDWPDRIVVVHLDDKTKEYDELHPELLSIEEMPDPTDFFDAEESNILIIDECDLSALKDTELSQVERLFSYTATHRNLIIFLIYQQLTRIPARVRRACNNYIVFKTTNLEELGTVARRVGCNLTDFKNLMNLCTDKHDSVWIDMTKPMEAKGHYRLNLWNCITVV